MGSMPANGKISVNQQKQRLHNSEKPVYNFPMQQTAIRTVIAVDGQTGNLLTSARYTYNAIGEMLSALDHEGNVLAVEYDLMGRRTAMESPDIGRKEYRYDKFGNLIRESDTVLRLKGKAINYHYDKMYRLTKIEYPESTATEYTYGGPNATKGTANRIATLTDESGTITYAYGALGETVEEKRSITHLDPTRRGAETHTIWYTSNYLGQLEAVAFDDNETVTYTYNRGGQVTKVTGVKNGLGGNFFEFPYVKDIGYDEFGQRIYIRYGNEVTTQYEYDPARRWLQHIETNGVRATYQNIDYTLDAVGNVLGYANNVSGYGLPSYESTYEQTFEFNAIGNMTAKVSSSRYPMPTAPGDNLNYQLQYDYLSGTHKAGRIGNTYYAYDENGNLLAEQQGSPITMPGGNAQVYEEDGVYSTDYGFALTNNRNAPETGSGSNAFRRDYEWNERNLLKQSVDRQYMVEYRYGADGQRAIKYSVNGGTLRNETRYFNKMFQTGTIAGQEMESKHIYVGEVRIVTKQKEVGNVNYSEEYNKQYYYHGDHLGSAQMVTDHDGAIYEHLEYTPYGELWVDHAANTAGENPTPFRFTGKELDPETGLYYYGARYLDPRTARWISVDPAMTDGSYIPSAPIDDEAKKRNQNLPGMGGVFNYVNMHVYHYAGNNPVKLIDPDGEWIAFKQQSDRFNKYFGEAAVQLTRTGKPTQREIANEARSREQSDLRRNGVFSSNISEAIKDFGLSGIEAENYRKEETARYEAFQSLREKSDDQDEFKKVINEAQSVYNSALGGGSRQEGKRRADAKANEVIDNFIRSKNPSYKPPVKVEE